MQKAKKFEKEKDRICEKMKVLCDNWIDAKYMYTTFIITSGRLGYTQ